MDLGGPDDAPEERAGGALRDRDVAPAVGVEQAQRVLGAVRDVGVAADGRDREQVELGSGHGQADRQGVVQSRVAVDDQRQRALRRPEGARRAPWR